MARRRSWKEKWGSTDLEFSDVVNSGPLVEVAEYRGVVVLRRYSRAVLTSDLVRLYPFLFHTAVDGSWPSIREHGLLSTAAVLDKWEVDDARRRELLTTVRAEGTVLEHPVLG